ncbi:MAG TPA: hypothetical protein VF450_06735 [Noviherbaspirillum sp.]
MRQVTRAKHSLDQQAANNQTPLRRPAEEFSRGAERKEVRQLLHANVLRQAPLKIHRAADIAGAVIVVHRQQRINPTFFLCAVQAKPEAKGAPAGDADGDEIVFNPRYVPSLIAYFFKELFFAGDVAGSDESLKMVNC